MAPSSFVPILFMALAATSLAATAPPPPIGPAANLVISNKYLQPDGFNRSYVLSLTLSGLGLSLSHYSTVVAGGTFPGSLITGKKVKWSRTIFTFTISLKLVIQGDRFQIDVIDSLTDNTMLRSTSIVSTGQLQTIQLAD